MVASCDGHQHFVRHMPCSEHFWLYDLKCWSHISVLLQKCYVDRAEPEFTDVCHGLNNIQKLVSCFGRASSWADQALYHMLSIGWIPPLLAFCPCSHCCGTSQTPCSPCFLVSAQQWMSVRSLLLHLLLLFLPDHWTCSPVWPLFTVPPVN